MSNRYAIGSITSGYRTIQNGDRFNHHFPKANSNDEIVIENGEVEDTVELMKKVVWRYIDDTKTIAKTLKGQTKDQTCKQIWNFLYHHIQYKLDKHGLEQLRRPARSWKDRKTGIDCDCFSIFASSILTNLRIPHSFRITKYGGLHFQHVYVVVPNGNGVIIIDPVLSKYNYEKPFTQNKDFPMNLNGIDVAVLSGTNNDIENVLAGFDELDGLGEASETKQLEAMYSYLVSTRNAIANNPDTVAHIEDPRAFIQMLDYAIQYWHTDKRDEALEILAQNEDKLNLQNGFSGIDDDEDDHYVDDFSLGRTRRGFFKKVGNFAKKVGSGVKKAATKAVKAVVRYNPVSVTARLGFLAAMKINLKKMAEKLKWAYASQAQAARKGVSASQWQRSKVALAKVEKLYADKLQGSRTALRDAILKGRAGGLNGDIDPGAYDLSGLGEPISIGASIAAATPVIVAAVNIMKDSGLFSPGEDTSTSNLQQEATDAQRSSNVPYELTVPVSRSASSEQTATEAQASPAPSEPSSQGGGVLAFIKKNPLVAVAGVGILGFGAFKLLGKKKPARGLSGTKRTPARKTTSKRSTTKRKTTRRKIQRVNLK